MHVNQCPHMLIFTGSTADGVADLEQFQYDSDVQNITKAVSEIADELQDEDKKKKKKKKRSRSSSSSSSSSDEDK